MILCGKGRVFPLNCINVSEYDYNNKVFVLQVTAGLFIKCISSKVFTLTQCLSGIILSLNMADSI